MAELQESVVSIWDGEINKKEAAEGSGFSIASKLIMTACHVVDGLKEEDIHIGWTKLETERGLGVARVHRIPHYDVAILELNRDHQNPALTCDYSVEYKNGLDVKLVAYNVLDKERKGPLDMQLSNIYKDEEHWRYHTYPSEGMSGGAIVYKGRAIGVLRAKHKEDNSGLIIPISLFKEEIEAQLLSPKNSNQNNQSTQASALSDDEYLEYQVNKLTRIFKIDKIKELKMAFYKHYFPEVDKPEDNSVSSLVETIKEAQLKIKKSADDHYISNNISKVSDIISDYLDEIEYDEAIKNHAETLFAIATSLMLIKCKIDNPDKSGVAAHCVSVADEHSLEFIAAQMYGTTPRSRIHDESVGAKGKDALTINSLRDKEWTHKKAAESVAIEVFNQIFKGRPYTKQQLASLNLFIRNKRKKDKNHYYAIVNTSLDKLHDLNKPDVVKELRAQGMLPDFPIFLFGNESDELMNEFSAMLIEFYTNLSEYAQKSTAEADTP